MRHTATLLPSGKVLVAGGSSTSGALPSQRGSVRSGPGTWTATGDLSTATLCTRRRCCPTGRCWSQEDNGTSAELYDPAHRDMDADRRLNAARYDHTATLLPNGKVLVAGAERHVPLSSAELFDPAPGTWTATGALNAARAVTRRPCCPMGRCWSQGGNAGTVRPGAGDVDADRRPEQPRRGFHTATLLPNGKVLVAAGYGWQQPGSFQRGTVRPGRGDVDADRQPEQRSGIVTRRPCCNGKVLVAGGLYGRRLSSQRGAVRSGHWDLDADRRAQHRTLFTRRPCCPMGRCWSQGASAILLPARSCTTRPLGTWTATGLSTTHVICHTATLLPNGKVLVVQGCLDSRPTCHRGTVRPGHRDMDGDRRLDNARTSHTATLLPNGKVLVAGGWDSLYTWLAEAELYDPALGTWTVTGSLGTGRQSHTATLLPNGKVLVAAGYGSGFIPQASAELYDVGLGFLRPDWQPQIATATSVLMTGSSFVLTGSRFQGISQASGGNSQDSSTNYPLVQLRSLENSQETFLPVNPMAGWSETAFTSTPVNDFPPVQPWRPSLPTASPVI